MNGSRRRKFLISPMIVFLSVTRSITIVAENVDCDETMTELLSLRVLVEESLTSWHCFFISSIVVSITRCHE